MKNTGLLGVIDYFWPHVPHDIIMFSHDAVNVLEQLLLLYRIEWWMYCKLLTYFTNFVLLPIQLQCITLTL